MRSMPRDLKIGLLGAAIFFYCLLSIQPVVSAEGIPDMAREIRYPDSVQEMREYHENFGGPTLFTVPASSIKDNAIDPKFVNEAAMSDDAAKVEGEIGETRMDPEAVFGKDASPEEIFLNMVVANTDDHKTEEHRTIVLGEDQRQSGEPVRVNSMDLEVAHITVIAINFARGGSAVATSEIYLQPTQEQSRAQS